MVHGGGDGAELTGLQLHGLRRVELVAHAQQERALDDRDVLVSRVRVRRDLVTRWQVQPDSEQGRLARVTLEDGNLGAGGKNRGRGTPCEHRRLRQHGSDGEQGEYGSRVDGTHSQLLKEVGYRLRIGLYPEARFAQKSHGATPTIRGPFGPGPPGETGTTASPLVRRRRRRPRGTRVPVSSGDSPRDASPCDR